MQRRAAAVYGGLLAVITIAAAAGIVTGWTPPVEYPDGEPQLAARLWAIAILAGLTSVVLFGSAYMPVRGD